MTTQSPILPKYHNGKGVLLKAPSIHDPKKWEEESCLWRIYQTDPKEKIALALHSRTLELRGLKCVVAGECANITTGLVATSCLYAYKMDKQLLDGMKDPASDVPIICQAVMFYGSAEPHLVSFGERHGPKTFLMRDGEVWYKADMATVVGILSDGRGVTMGLFETDGENRKELSVTHIERPKLPLTALPPRK